MSDEAETKIGRPSVYSEDVGAEICARLMDGESLKAICESDHMPARATVTKWLAENTYPMFSASYARAREAQADTDADDIGDLARKAARGEVDPAAARAAIDALKWTAARRQPKKYGDKQEIAHTVSWADLVAQSQKTGQESK